MLVEGAQYGGGCAVRTCRTIRTGVSHLRYGGGFAVKNVSRHQYGEVVQYGSVTSVRTRVCSSGLPKLLRG